MKQKLYLLFIIVSLLTYTLQIDAQDFSPTEQVIFANGGIFGDLENVSLGTYKTTTNEYAVFDSIQTQSVQEIVIADNFAYVAAQDSLIKYDLTTLERSASQAFESGASLFNLLIYGDYVIAGKWFGGSALNYVQFFNKSDLSFAFSIPQIVGTPAGMVIIDDKLYISQNDVSSTTFSDTLGRLAVVDLATQTFEQTIELDNNGADLGRLYTADNKIYSLNPASNTVTTFDVTTQTNNTKTVDSELFINVYGYGNRATFVDNKIYTVFNNTIGYYDVDTESVTTLFDISDNSFGVSLAYDSVNKTFYTGQTDFFTYSTGIVYNETGDTLAILPLGNSPEAVATDIAYITGFEEPSLATEVTIFPTLASNHIQITASSKHVFANYQVQITDLSGKVLYKNVIQNNTNIPIHHFANGIYLVSVIIDNQVITKKIIKQ